MGSLPTLPGLPHNIQALAAPPGCSKARWAWSDPLAPTAEHQLHHQFEVGDVGAAHGHHTAAPLGVHTVGGGQRQVTR